MIDKLILELADKNRKNSMDVFGDLLDYIINGFDPMGTGIKDWPYDKDSNVLFYDAFTELTGEYRDGIQKRGWTDPLGDTFMRLHSRADTSRKGAFFTPECLCTLMADVSVDVEGKYEKHFCGTYGRRMIVNDPTAGSSRNLLAVKAKFADKPEPEQPYFIAEDIDPMCVKMSAINLCFHGCYGEAVCHDSLAEPDKCKFGYIINIGIRYGQLPSIIYSSDNGMFECIALWRNKADRK